MDKAALAMLCASDDLDWKEVMLFTQKDAREMLDSAVANRFIQAVGNGRTKPLRLEVSRADGTYVDVVAKFSEGCDRKVTSLAVEAICAMLAADLGLPVPEPLLVEIDPQFIELIPSPEIRQLLELSDPTGFGSAHLPRSFSVWTASTPITSEILRDATGILAFDLLVQNVDRRPVNPNCLTDGNSLGIFDHEIALNTDGVLFWKPPWKVGGLDDFKGSEKHIFYNGLRKKHGVASELDVVCDRWRGIPSNRFQEYLNALPSRWNVDHTVPKAINYLEQTRDNIEASIDEVKRILA